jgi:hypothetical protein
MRPYANLALYKIDVPALSYIYAAYGKSSLISNGKERKLLQKYSLPTAYDLMERPPTKWKWKAMLNKAVEEHHMTEWYNQLLLYWSFIASCLLAISCSTNSLIVY